MQALTAAYLDGCTNLSTDYYQRAAELLQDVCHVFRRCLQAQGMTRVVPWSGKDLEGVKPIWHVQWCVFRKEGYVALFL
jgi:hypothetical protein